MMIFHLVLKNTRIVDGNSFIVRDIGIDKKGIIREIASGLPGKNEINLEDKYTLPGLVDIHVHFRDLGQEYKETWKTGSMAAQKGGITYVGDMPNNLDPITTLEKLEKKRIISQKDSFVNFGLYAAVIPENLPNLRELSPHVIAFKLFMGDSTGRLNLAYDEIPDAFGAVAKTGKLLCLHAEDQRILDRNPSRPPEAEIEAIKYALQLSKEYKVPLHICHLTTKRGLELISEAKHDDIDVTCEVSPHHLFLDKKHAEELGSYAKMNPPLRSKQDQTALWKGIIDGTVDMIASDHAPHTKDEKNSDKPSSGVPGVETTLPLILNAVNNRKLSFSRLVGLMHDNPVARFGLGRYGCLERGNITNLTVVDPDANWEIKDEQLLTKCGWSPYHKWKGKGRPTGVVVNGNYSSL
jgi:dihydroorotase